MSYVETAKGKFSIPDGWSLEQWSSMSSDFYVLSTHQPLRYSATIDFKNRGVRSGVSTTCRMLGEKWVKNKLVRPKYEGRGWKQKLVDAAVAHLNEVLK